MADMTGRAVELMREAGRLFQGMAKDGHSAPDVLDMLKRQFMNPKALDECLIAAGYFNASEEDWVPGATETGATERAIRRALAESAQPGQAAAIACFIVLRGIPTALHGSLSETPEGGLRLLSPTGEKPRGGTVPMLEQFFDYQDVACFGVPRAVPSDEPPPIIVHPRGYEHE